MDDKKAHFLIGTRWFGVLGPCKLIIEELVDAGFEVFVFGQKDEHYARYDYGQANLIQINMSRSYISFISDFIDLLKISYYIVRYKPVGVHSFNPKPALLAWVSVLTAPKTKFFIGVTGLGNTFIKARLMQPIIASLLKGACKRASCVFFQNPDDLAMFIDRKIVSQEKTKIFIGPGVDTELFSPSEKKKHADNFSDEVSKKITVTCTARLIWQKGIKEYVETAQLVKNHYKNKRDIEFLLVGEFDNDHPDCVDKDFIEKATSKGIVKHISWTDDVVGILNRTDIFILHSYREGAPRAILEASSMCIPTIGADAVGVRELVEHGVTGYLTPLKQVEPIVNAVISLIEDANKRTEMGKQAQIRIAERLSLRKSSDSQMRMYREAGYALPRLMSNKDG